MTHEPLAIYLHIPFCSTMCSYCAFNTYTNLDNLIPAFVEALIKEIEILGTNNPGMPVKTIYFGGGTPSLLTPQQYEKLFSTLNNKFRIVNNAEISLESNPDDLNVEYLKALREVGFNRISIGMQTANPDILTLYNRRHSVKQVYGAVAAAYKANFNNVSLDVIFNAPHETLNTWRETLETVIDINPEHISHYELILKGNTDLTLKVENGELPMPDDDDGADMYELATEMLRGAGYTQYEISNWSKVGYESEHNLQYWRNLPYLGLGSGAHGYAADYRTVVLRHPAKYIENMQDAKPEDYQFPNTPALSQLIKLDEETDKENTILMGLRMTQEGIQRITYKNRFGIDFYEEHKATIEKFIGYNMLYIDDTVVRLTERGRLLANTIISELI